MVEYPQLRNSEFWRAEDGEQISSSGFLDRIRRSFPGLKWKRYRRVQDGADHVVFVLDGEYVFRFTRGNELDDIVNVVRERVVLDVIAPRLSLPIPRYTFVPAEPDYAGYRIIAGTRLSPWRFRRLSRQRRREAARDLGQFLGELHEIPVDEMKRLGISEETSIVPEDELRRLKQSLDDPSSRVDDTSRATCQRWLEEVGAASFDCDPTFVHDDFWHKHIYHDPDSGSISGIIDWGDVCIKDPAKDFYGLWTYGESFVDDVLSHYRPANDELQSRSLLHYKRIVCSCLGDNHGIKGLRYGGQILNGNHHL